jgi:NAD(P)-dependent dehydrogenase (short-subunit alcohol dehydrogenase family)
LLDLSGKTVLVTGGSRGIGAAAVSAIAAAGGEVLLHYGKNRELAERIC